ncbi:hypothetical protein [Actinomadura xylanilytica]|uniref:hypothetical protein n=1 Tax=Actinomadura xylanilytica TaxID=887459 RepID=UPI00255AC01B|nr:hypothetical protein [Actinomadura xylanilytica]MDL4777598.1 hypothetical protein [Actinomadura xylanilytica]
MTILAAAATSNDPSGSLLLLALVASVGYIAACAVWPFRACRPCRGLGRFHSPTGRAWHPCRRCNGTGAKLRFGRRIYAALRNTRDRSGPRG